jgi:hypothetical protein
LSRESTSLTLLSTDGLFTVTFSPRLTAAQYADLAEVVKAGILSKKQFCEQFAHLAAAWGTEFTSDGSCN